MNAETSMNQRAGMDKYDIEAENESRAMNNMRKFMPVSQPGKRTLKAKAGYRGQMVDSVNARERLCNWRRATA